MRLKFVSLITTYRCNFRCHMCNIWQNPTSRELEIKPGDLAKLPEVGAVNITGGEPFLRDDLSEILAVLRSKTKRVVVSTSGYLTDRILAVAKEHPWIGVRVSVEGLPAANDDLRGVKDGFDHALNSLVELRHLGLRDVGFGITLSDRNFESLLPLYHMAKLMRLEFATAAVHNSFYFHKHDNRIERKSEMEIVLRRLIDELLESSRPKDWFRAYFNWGLLRYTQGRPRLLPCRMGTDACFIDPYGEVLPCNGMKESIGLGNIKKTTFEEIWNSVTAKRVREMVGACNQNCWMMGSVAEPMKANLAVVSRWVLREKLRVMASRSSSTAKTD